MKAVNQINTHQGEAGHNEELEKNSDLIGGTDGIEKGGRKCTACQVDE